MKLCASTKLRNSQVQSSQDLSSFKTKEILRKLARNFAKSKQTSSIEFPARLICTVACTVKVNVK